jgi:hypothetical protein
MFSVVILAMASLVATASSVKRQTTTAFGLYAYGDAIGGWEVRYSDGNSIS